MTTELPEYAKVVEPLTPLLSNLPGKLVAIDGRDGSGKTTLGRYLAWYFNVSLIETDLFLLGDNGLKYENNQINSIIEKRLRKPRPVIIEGITILGLLKDLDRDPDFLIYLKNHEFGGSMCLSKVLERYEQEYNPERSANVVIELSH